MTRKQLRSKCLINIDDLNPSVIFPDVNAEVMRAIRVLTESVGGIFKTATLTTVAGIREHGITATSLVASGFPADFISSIRMLRSDGVRVYPMNMWERSESTSTGPPMRYYIVQRGRKMGWDFLPAAGYVITWEYFGNGDTLTKDDDVVLPELSIVDDDPFWDGVVHAFGEKYWQRKFLRSKESMERQIISENYNLCRHEGAQDRLSLSSFLNTFNADRMAELEPDSIFDNLLNKEPFGNIIERLDSRGGSQIYTY